MNCPDCNTKMTKIETCCQTGEHICNTTHYYLTKPYYKCPKCKIEIEISGKIKIKGTVKLQLSIRLKRMIVTAHTMGWSIKKVHKAIDKILDEYEAKQKSNKNENKIF